MMKKISEYPENVAPVKTSYVIVAYEGQNYKMRLRNLLASFFLNWRTAGAYIDDLLGNSEVAQDNWRFASSGLGSFSQLPSDGDHVGLMGVSAGALAGSGVVFAMGNTVSSFVLQGGEETTMIFKLSSTADLFMHYGFSDELYYGVLPEDAVRIEITGNSLVGKAWSSSTTFSTTASSYTVQTGTWYNVKIAMSQYATRVDFYLYDEDGNLLWTDYLTTDIPTDASNFLFHGGGIFRSVNAASGIDYAVIDLVTLRFTEEMTR